MKTNQVPFGDVTLQVKQITNAENCIKMILQWCATWESLVQIIHFKILSSVLVCTNNMDQHTTMIKKVLLDTFGGNINPSLKDIHRTSFIEEWKLNLNKSTYEKILKKALYRLG